MLGTWSFEYSSIHHTRQKLEQVIASRVAEPYWALPLRLRSASVRPEQGQESSALMSHYL